MEEVKKRIGLLIKERRKDCGMTQQELGNKLGIDKSTVASYEAGRNNFTVITLERISEAVGGELVIDIKRP